MQEDQCTPKPQLLGFGMSLLDMVIDGSQELLDKYGLAANEEIRATGDLLSIFKDVIESYRDNIHSIPGGATLNALKVAQWCLGESGSTVVVSCVSDDTRGQVLREAMSRARVDSLFQVKTELPTGVCLVICTGSNRCLVTYGGASNLFTDDFFDQQETQAAVDASQYFYCSGYSLIGCPESVHRLAVHASQHDGKIFTINLAAVYVCSQYCSRLMSLLPYVDVIFGNEAEAFALSKACNLQARTLEDVAQCLAKWKREGTQRKPRVVVITRGPLPALLVSDTILEFSPSPVSDAEMIDANGAGDAFVGGFLSSLMLGKSLKNCMISGHQAARTILGQRGCHLPDTRTVTVGN